uniref:ATP synthase F0 subunit 8 n=1 Tax=Sophonia microstaina TaxID=3092775 RepID=A0AAF0YYI5_9HEMI|nr:ATP synthase F0 subunit 8 [Sophonia microstaina]WPC85237.1 ATP synthase F0 subunit 8 [Sophonia microstaina]
MPQMSPMWWLLLMIYFIFVMTLFNSMVYFIFYKKNHKEISSKKFMLNWKW